MAGRERIAPEANDVTNRFEDIDQLLLWGAQDEAWTKSGKTLSSPML